MVNPPAEFVVNLITAFRVNVEEVLGQSKHHPSGCRAASKNAKVATSVVKDVVKNVVKIDLSQLTDRQITILEFMIQFPTITAKEMSQKLSVTSRTIQRDIAILINKGKVIREGGRYDGNWKVVIK